MENEKSIRGVTEASGSSGNRLQGRTDEVLGLRSFTYCLPVVFWGGCPENGSFSPLPLMNARSPDVTMKNQPEVTGNEAKKQTGLLLSCALP